MKTVGISAAGGVGHAIAHRIIHGLPPSDMYELDICRFLGLHNNRKFLRDRSKEVPGMYISVNIYLYFQLITFRIECFCHYQSTIKY